MDGWFLKSFWVLGCWKIKSFCIHGWMVSKKFLGIGLLENKKFLYTGFWGPVVWYTKTFLGVRTVSALVLYKDTFFGQSPF